MPGGVIALAMVAMIFIIDLGLPASQSRSRVCYNVSDWRANQWSQGMHLQRLRYERDAVRVQAIDGEI